MGSKRLPGKVLLPLNGHTVIEEVLGRCKRIPGVDQVLCAVPIPKTQPDQGLANIALKHVSVWHGPEQDVLLRYFEAARFVGLEDADIIIRVTGDCPLICPELCGEVWRKLVEEEADYSSNIEPRTFPQGLDCEAFTMKTLKRAIDHGPDEHVTTWMRTSKDVKRVHVTLPWKIEGRLTLDTQEDYRAICNTFGHEAHERLRAA